MKLNPEAKLLVKMLMCLPLLPKDRILNGFKYIQDRTEKAGLMKHFQKLFAYYQSYWLEQQVWFIVLCRLVLYSIVKNFNYRM